MGHSFKDDNSTIILLDFNNQVWRSYHATKNEQITNSDGINVGCIIGLMKIIRSAINKTNGNFDLVFCQDRYPVIKQKLYENNQQAFKDYEERVRYKGTRKREELDYNPVEICDQFIKCLPSIIIYAKHQEADDVIASFLERNKNKMVHLYSSDKDLWQLIPRYKKLKIFVSEDKQPTTEDCLKHFNTPDYGKILLHKIIRGDSGDNVKSVRNFQFKRTIEAFDKCNGKIEDYLKWMINLFGEDHKYVKKLFDNAHLLRVNYLVVKLRKNIKYETIINTKCNREAWQKLCTMHEIPSLFNSPLLRIT